MSWRIPPGARQHEQEHERTQEQEHERTLEQEQGPDALPNPVPVHPPHVGACPACGGPYPYPPTPTLPVAPVVAPFYPPPYPAPVAVPGTTWPWYTTVTTNTFNLHFV